MSPVDIVAISNIDYILIPKANLMDHKMKEALVLRHPLFDDSNINQRKGQCVLDYLMSEIRSVCPHFNDITRQHLIDYFGKDCTTTGITARQILDWVRTKKDISCVVFDPLHLAIDEVKATSGTRLTLAFMVGNNHLLPCTDKDRKTYANKYGKLDLQDIVYQIKDFDKARLVATEASAEAEQLIATIQTPIFTESVIIVEPDICFAELINECIQQTSCLVYHIQYHMREPDPIMFQHPITNQIIIRAPDYSRRKACCTRLFQETNYAKFAVWENQSWPQLGRYYQQAVNGKWEASQYGPHYLDIIKDYPISAYFAKVNAIDEPIENITSVDTRLAYPSLFLNNTIAYPIFTAFDDIQEFQPSTQFMPGEYYLANTIYIANQTIKISKGFKPLNLVIYLLQKQYITRDDITHYIHSSKFLPADFFRNSTQKPYILRPKQRSQRTVNH